MGWMELFKKWNLSASYLLHFAMPLLQFRELMASQWLHTPGRRNDDSSARRRRVSVASKCKRVSIKSESWERWFDILSSIPCMSSSTNNSLLIPAVISLHLMFYENVHLIAIILHTMNMIKAAVNHVNPSQIPVTTLDQPPFALGKLIQWNWPSTHGEVHSDAWWITHRDGDIEF